MNSLTVWQFVNLAVLSVQMARGTASPANPALRRMAMTEPSAMRLHKPRPVVRPAQMVVSVMAPLASLAHLNVRPVRGRRRTTVLSVPQELTRSMGPVSRPIPTASARDRL